MAEPIRALGRWLEDRTGLWAVVRRLAEHPVPPGTDWRYVLGSATLVAFLLQVATGVALSTVYVPSTGSAYQSLQFITHDAPFGRVLRGMHYFGASAMVILIGAHMARVFLTGSYKFPREMNWLSGAALLLLTLVMAFTGQLLRWDQDGVWSAVVASEQAARVPAIGHWLAHLILGGATVSGPTLSRSFTVHVFLIPALIFGGVGLHLYLILRNGISEPASIGPPTVNPATYRAWYRKLLDREGRPFWPDAAWRDAVMAILVVGAVLALALTLGPKALGKPPDPTAINASPRPDWYFLWYFAVLALIPRAIEPSVIVVAPLAFGLILVLLPLVANRGSRKIRHRPWAVAVVAVAVGTIAWFSQVGARSPWSPDFDAQPLAPGAIASSDPDVVAGAALFHSRGCEYCHAVGDQGGSRGPDLTSVALRLTHPQLEARILGGGATMPAYMGKLSAGELAQLVAFLESRRGPRR
ncbi:MAG: cytochrome b N-terminal domain-containing protein [Gemmatimonadales bacterium]